MNVYEILEQCLVEIEQGADVDTVLFRRPEHADELRPILEASIRAKSMVAPVPSAEAMRRNRAKVLQRAAEMREVSVKHSLRIWFASLRRAAVMLTILVLALVSGTGLVRAASNTIPGDNLYPVKRTWEDVLLLFTFDPQQRQQLEFEHENERLEELNELIAEGRSEKVNFAGYVTRRSGNEWRVSGIPVIVSPQAILPDQPVIVGAAVRIVGQTRSDGTVIAERVELLPAGFKLPDVKDDESEIEQENSNESSQSVDGNSNSGSENEAPEVKVTKTPEPGSKPKEESFEGVLESVDDRNKIWVVSGRQLNVSAAEIKGTPVIGAAVKVEGYFDPDGVFVVTRIEIAGSSNDNDASTNDNDDNSNNDDENDDDDNKNDNDGGNSGSGSGGGDD